MSYNIIAKRPGAKKGTCIKGIKDDDRADQLVRALLHEGFKVTIEEEAEEDGLCVSVISNFDMAKQLREQIKKQAGGLQHPYPELPSRCTVD